jgi:hypothetical protein
MQNVNQWDALKGWVQGLEAQLNVGITSAPVAIPIGIPNATRITCAAGIDADTVFGVGHVGGVDMDQSINSLFGLVMTLEAKVQILSE